MQHEKPVPRNAEELIDIVRYVGRECGYAIGVHGTLMRDIDLMAMAWGNHAVTPKELADRIAKDLGWQVRGEPLDRPRGRTSFIVGCNELKSGWFHRYIDLSVMDAMAHAEGLAIESVELRAKVDSLEKQLTELRLSASPSP